MTASEAIAEVATEMGVRVLDHDGHRLGKHEDFDGYYLCVVTGKHAAEIEVAIPKKFTESAGAFKEALRHALWVWRTR